MKLAAMGQFSFVLLACCMQAVICSTGNYIDMFSLLDFKKQIRLDPQQALMSWNGSTHLCSWNGVRCSIKKPSRVTSLNLTKQGLVGQISPSLGNLTFLKVLVLSANSFLGEIPMSLGHLHHLQMLDLNNNTLQGKIPALANCSKLTRLSMAWNQLTGEIPVDLPSRLEALQLGANNLTGTVPASLGNITTLKRFSFAVNNIEGSIPAEVANLQGLQVLYVDLNKMLGPIPQPILNLSNLVFLSIASNNFSGVIPSSVGTSLPNLQQFGIGRNLFQEHVPSSLTNAS